MTNRPVYHFSTAIPRDHININPRLLVYQNTKNCPTDRKTVFTKNVLDQDNEYIEFKVNIKIPSSGSSHLFLGLVNKAKYKTEFLSKF